MRRLSALVVLVAFPSTLWAQDPTPLPEPVPVPIVEQAIIIQHEEITLSPVLTDPAAQPKTTTVVVVQPANYPRKLFWLGLGLALTGIVLTGLSVTRYQESDLSEEHPSTRLNQHLAPCGTDPDETTLPIADCKVNVGLLYVGMGVTAGGTAVAWYAVAAGTRAPPMAQPTAQLHYRVRF